MTKFQTVVTGVIGASLVCLCQSADAQGWASTVPPWRGPSAASRSTTPSNFAAPFNAYYPAYGSYPDPVEQRNTAVSQGNMAGFGGSAYSNYGYNTNRVATGHAGETLYYGGETIMQPEAVAPAEQVGPPGVLQPMQQNPMPLEAFPPSGMPQPGASAPMMMPDPCVPSDPCGAANPCCPPCPASWQHRCGHRLGDMLAKMRECCDKIGDCLKSCCPKPQPQPCCWTGYRAWWHAPQPSDCSINQCLPSDQMRYGQGNETGVPLDMELATPGVEMIDEAASQMYESVEPNVEVLEEGPSFTEYGRPTFEETSVTLPTRSPPSTDDSHRDRTTAPGRVEASGRVENEPSESETNPSPESIEVETLDMPAPELLPPTRDDATT